MYADLDEHSKVFEAFRADGAVQSAIAGAIDACVNALNSDSKLLFCGNGGSAADSQHLATEFTIRYKKNRRALAAIALTTDTSALTACGNDLGFDAVFSRQVEALGRKGDVLLAFSTSGKSPNVILAVEAAKEAGMTTIFFGGGDGGTLRAMCDVSIVVPSHTTARIQEMHILIGHILIGQIEDRLGLAGE